jgi:putative transposase
MGDDMGYYDPVNHHRPVCVRERTGRRSIRLKGYDYSQPGAYFVTMCTQGRAHCFGKVQNQKMIMNDAGKMIERWYMELEHKFPDIQCHDYIVMPNHMHCIIVRADLRVCPDGCVCPHNDHTASPHDDVCPDNNRGEHAGSPLRVNTQPVTIPRIIQWFKTMTTNEYIRNVKQQGWPAFQEKLWQRNYYEHIIRDNLEYQKITTYIRNNPKNWREDEFSDNPRN